MYLTVILLHLSLVHLFKPAVTCLVPHRISQSIQQITRLHIPEGRNCCTDGSENLKAPNFRMFLQTKIDLLYPSARETRAKQNSATRGSKLHNDVTTGHCNHSPYYCHLLQRCSHTTATDSLFVYIW